MKLLINMTYDKTVLTLGRLNFLWCLVALKVLWDISSLLWYRVVKPDSTIAPL